MRVCFVCGNIYPLLAKRADIPIVGGAEVQQYLIGRELAQRGVEVCYVTEDFGQGIETTSEGFRVLAYKYGRNKVRQGVTLWRALHRADADIYYVRGMPKFGGLIYVFCRAYRRKIVQALANDVEVTPEASSGLLWSITYRVHAFWRARADLVIAQTHFQAERLKQRWHIMCEVIPNVVPVALQPEPRRASGRLAVLWVGAISAKKRPQVAAEIARFLPQIDFTIVGGPIRGLEDYYEQMRGCLIRYPNVRWLGYVPHSQVRKLFQEAEVLLHTGDGRREGFPNVFLQAWAEGAPVVSTGVDPDGVIVAHGLGFCSPSIEQVAQDLHRLSVDRTLLKEMGQKAWNYVSATHRPDVVIPRYVALFRRLIG